MSLVPHDDTVICVYDLAKFSGDVVMDVMRTHPMIIVGGILQQNPFFMPPQEFLQELYQRRAEQARVHADRRLIMQADLLSAENKQLQRCVNDLVSIMALPAMWVGRDPAQIAESLLDSVLGMLDLDFAHLHLNDPSGDLSFEVARLSQWASGVAPQEGFAALLTPWTSTEVLDRPRRLKVGGSDLAVLPCPSACSEKSDRWWSDRGGRSSRA